MGQVRVVVAALRQGTLAVMRATLAVATATQAIVTAPQAIVTVTPAVMRLRNGDYLMGCCRETVLPLRVDVRSSRLLLMCGGTVCAMWHELRGGWMRCGSGKSRRHRGAWVRLGVYYSEAVRTD